MDFGIDGDQCSSIVDQIIPLSAIFMNTLLSLTALAADSLASPLLLQCGHCKNMKPEFISAAADLEGQGSSFRLAAIDCTENSKTCGEHGVKVGRKQTYLSCAVVCSIGSIVNVCKGCFSHSPAI